MGTYVLQRASESINNRSSAHVPIIKSHFGKTRGFVLNVGNGYVKH